MKLLGFVGLCWAAVLIRFHEPCQCKMQLLGSNPVWQHIILLEEGTRGWCQPSWASSTRPRMWTALYRVPVRQTGPYLSAHAGVPEAGGPHLRLPAPPALESHMGVFPLRPLGRTARHRVHTRVHTSNAHSTRPPPRLHLSASTSFHCRLAFNPPVRHPCLPRSSLVVLLVDLLLHRFLALDFTILKAWDYWEPPRGSLRYSWGWRCWRVVVGFWRSPEPKDKYFC